jgi:hypothetical protein
MATPTDSAEEEHFSSSGDWKVGGVRVFAWTSGDIRENEWVYLGIEFKSPPPELAEYEVLRDGAPAAPRAALVPSARLYRKTGFVDNDPSPSPPGVLGGAERLPPGIYEVVFHVTLHDGSRHALRGVRFEVAARSVPGGGWQIKPPPRVPNR